MAEGKNTRVDGVRKNPFRGRPKSPAVFLCRTAKVPPAGVGFHAEGDPGSWRCLWPSGGGAKGYLRSGVVPRPMGFAHDATHSKIGRASCANV